jgi:hypothetical protein
MKHHVVKVSQFPRLPVSKSPSLQVSLLGRLWYASGTACHIQNHQCLQSLGRRDGWDGFSRLHSVTSATFCEEKIPHPSDLTVRGRLPDGQHLHNPQYLQGS